MALTRILAVSSFSFFTFARNIMKRENQISNFTEALVNNKLLSFIIPNINIINGRATHRIKRVYPMVLQ